MKVLSIQTVTVTDAPLSIHENRVAVHHEIAPGTFVHVGVSASGVTVWRGKMAVQIPFENLMALAVSAEPDLAKSDPPREVPAAMLRTNEELTKAREARQKIAVDNAPKG